MVSVKVAMVRSYSSLCLERLLKNMKHLSEQHPITDWYLNLDITKSDARM